MRILAPGRVLFKDNTFAQSLIVPKGCLTKSRFCFVFWMALSGGGFCKVKLNRLDSGSKASPTPVKN